MSLSDHACQGTDIAPYRGYAIWFYPKWPATYEVLDPNGESVAEGFESIRQAMLWIDGAEERREEKEWIAQHPNGEPNE